MKKITKSIVKGYCKYSKESSTRVLITGSQGQIGTELIDVMREKYGNDNVIASDIMLPRDLRTLNDGPYYFVDVCNKKMLDKLVSHLEVDWIVHLGAFLSAASEITPEPALELNTVGLHNVLDIAEKYELKTFVPSSIAAFGPTTPLDDTPDICSQRPRSVYGVGKVYAELLGEYYNEKRGLDFLSLRYPGVISWKTKPAGGTTDYSVEMFYYALEGKEYECYIDQDERLPMMYMEDCLKSTIDLLEADTSRMTQRTYNVQGCAFTPKELELEIQKHIPDFKVVYKPDNLRQPLAHSWPNNLDDSLAREEWDWKEDFDLENMVKDMLVNLEVKLKEDGVI